MSYRTPPPPPPPPPAGPPVGPWPGGYAGMQPVGSPYAHWGKRVGAYLIDGLIGGLIGFVPFIIGAIVMATGSHETIRPDGTDEYTVSGSHAAVGVVFFVLGGLGALAFAVWNIMLKEGRTGYTVGKGVVGIKVVREATGRPVGPGLALGRQLLHLLDSAICYLGYLWPLWDPKRQTFADKIVGTVVLDLPRSRDVTPGAGPGGPGGTAPQPYVHPPYGQPPTGQPPYGG